MPGDFSERIGSASDLQFTRAAAGEGFTPRSKASSMPVFVDVGSRKIDSRIERDGVPIGVISLDPTLLQDHLLSRPIVQVAVVQQSIPKGTSVPVGTTVDLVLAPTRDLPLGIISGIHTDLALRTIGETFALVKDNPLVNRIVARSVAGQLAPEDMVAVREIFDGIEGAEISDEPGKDLNAAVETLRALKTFGG